MKCKPIFTALIIISLAIGCGHSGSKKSGIKSDKKALNGVKTQLTGKIEHSDVTEAILISDYFTDTANINPTGEFKFSFNLPTGSYLRLRFETHSVLIFLNPADNLYLECIPSDIFSTIQFQGKGAEANNYLKEKYQQMLHHNISISQLYEAPEKEFRFLADSIYVIEKIFLDEYAKMHPELTDWFISQEHASLLYDWATKLMEYPRLTSNPKAIDKNTYFSFLKKLNVNDAALLNVFEYKQFLNAYIAWYTDEKINANADKNLKTHEVNLIRMQMTNKLITDETVKNYLLASVIKEQVKYFGYKNTEQLFEVFELNCTDTQLKNGLLVPFQEYKKLTMSNKAPEVTFVDLSGITFSLDNFIGSYVYLDIWATWCLPCKRESPHFEELSRKFSGKNIQFISLSVDTDIRAWKEFLTIKKLTHNQFLITNPDEFLESYFIKTIPRFIIINPEGKIVESDAFRPSEPDLKWFTGLPDKRAI